MDLRNPLQELRIKLVPIMLKLVKCEEKKKQIRGIINKLRNLKLHKIVKVKALKQSNRLTFYYARIWKSRKIIKKKNDLRTLIRGSRKLIGDIESKVKLVSPLMKEVSQLSVASVQHKHDIMALWLTRKIYGFNGVVSVDPKLEKEHVKLFAV